MLFRKKKNLNEASLGLKIGAIFGILFLHVPLFFIILYAFTTEDKSYQFPPPGYTLKWLSIVLGREDIWNAVGLSLQVLDWNEIGIDFYKKYNMKFDDEWINCYLEFDEK